MEELQIRAAQKIIDDDMNRADREAEAEKALHEEYAVSLASAITYNRWQDVYAICDQAHFDFEEWAKRKMGEDSTFAEELTNAIFYGWEINAIECAKNIVDAIDFAWLVDRRLESEDEDAREEREMRGER